MANLPSFAELFGDMNFHRALFNTLDLFTPLARLKEYLTMLTGGQNDIKGFVHPSAVLVGDGIVVESEAFVDAHALIQGPVVISRKSFIGHGALVRANTLIGAECVVGHSSEIKDSVMFPRSRAGHFNFIGDSMIGSYVNLGGGTIISNFEFPGRDGERRSVSIRVGSDRVDTGLEKLGAIVGDHVSTGANSVLSPGSILGKGASVYPTVCVRKGLTESGAKITQGFYDE